MFRRWTCPLTNCVQLDRMGTSGPSRCPMSSYPGRPRRVGWVDIARLQGGIISRSQLLDLDLTPAQAKSEINNGRWLSTASLACTRPSPARSERTEPGVRGRAAHARTGRRGESRHDIVVVEIVGRVPRPSSTSSCPNHVGYGVSQPSECIADAPSTNPIRVSSFIHPSAKRTRLRVEEAVLIGL